MYRSVAVSYWITLALSVLAAGFLTRIFIIFHDCGHGSFFPSQRANDIVGFIAGVFTFTPYYGWRHEHAIHHATAGDLDRRGIGDIWTLTVKEYLALPPMKRLGYRLFQGRE
jgi:omega-6 fatty acid desaturase (delta-12 desaturase)